MDSFISVAVEMQRFEWTGVEYLWKGGRDMLLCRD